MTDFPRGWTLSVDVAGVAASITVPAIPGVAHVLDAFAATMTSIAAGGQLKVVRVSSSDGTFNNLVLGRLATATPAAGSAESSSASGSDLGLAAGPGASLTVAFDASVAGLSELLMIQGHDI